MTIYDLGAMPWERVLHEVTAERQRQDDKWGEQNHPDRMPDGYPYGDSPDYAKAARYWQSTNATRVGWMNAAGEPSDRGAAWEGVLLQAVYEALAESDPAKLRVKLIQVAAVPVAWIEAIDRRAAA